MGMRGRLAVGYPPNCQFHFYNFHGVMVREKVGFVQEPENPENPANENVMESEDGLDFGRAANSEKVQGAFHPAATCAKDVGVDHGGRDIIVPQELLHGADIGAALEGVGGETMAESVAAGAFGQPDPGDGRLDRLVNGSFIQEL